MNKPKQNCMQIYCKLPKYKILFKDILTFLGFDHRNASYGHSGNNDRVSTLFKSYRTTTVITMPSLKSIGQL